MRLLFQQPDHVMQTLCSKRMGNRPLHNNISILSDTSIQIAESVDYVPHFFYFVFDELPK